LFFLYLACAIVGWMTDFRSDFRKAPEEYTVALGTEMMEIPELPTTNTKVVKSHEFEVIHQPSTFPGAILLRLRTGHRWVRIFTRRAKDPFSRPRRIILVWSFVMSLTACNAIFYQARESVSYLDSIVVGFYSSLLCTPINFVIVFLLLRARSRKYSKPENKGNQSLLRRILVGTWPWWCAAIGYALSLVVVGLSMYIVLLYALYFPLGALTGWVTSSSISVLFDIFINQPIVNIFLAIVGVAWTRFRK